MIDKCLINIGVYGFTEDDFFKRLIDSGTDMFIDIRQRRGVRGSKYAFVNSNRLQNRLAELNINYMYVKELAPTKEIRELQKRHDLQNTVEKRKRTVLGEIFTNEYESQILEKFNETEFNMQFGKTFFRPCFFCVEGSPDACHRSLVCNKLSGDSKILSIMP